MDSDLAQGAIAAAIAGNWKSAIQLNTHILELRPDDIDALNRLARAYCEMSQLPEAISVCKKVLLLDPLNPIANKSLRRFEELESSGFSQLTPCVTAHPSVFVEEAGKTKNISLRNLGSSDLFQEKNQLDKYVVIHQVCT
jgi:tetratricopeptide (TPR) repeat protein